jgi:hypothetical protein
MHPPKSDLTLASMEDGGGDDVGFVARVERLLANGNAQLPELLDVQSALVGTLAVTRSERLLDLQARVAAAIDDRRRRPSPRWIYAAAAAIAIAAAIALLVSRPDRVPERTPVTRPAAPPRAALPEPVIRSYGRAAWDEAVARVRNARRLEAPPIVAALHPPPRKFRSDAPAPPVAGTFAPNGVVLVDDRPRFTWPEAGATYLVFVYSEGRLFAESPRLSATTWQAPNLERGRTYQWQVEVTRDSETFVMPARPREPARFHVVSAAAAREVADARASADPLLVAVVAARHGLQREALDAAQRITDDDLRRPLLASLEEWPKPRS